MLKGFLCLTVSACLLGAAQSALAAGPTASNASPGLGESISSAGKSVSQGFTGGVKKLSQALTPKTPVRPADDPTSLGTQAQASPELLISVGLLAEQGGRVAEAEQKYQEALKANPRHFGALMALARFRDRRGQFEEAVRLYQQAAQVQPNQAAVYNDLGLCYARRNLPREAVAQLERAVQLQPEQPLYRNNLATVLVDMGDVDRAYAHLVAVHDEATAFYNLGYLMHKKGQPKAAAVLFSKALERDPTMVDAQAWLERLQSQPTTSSLQAGARSPGQPVVPSAPLAGPSAFGRQPMVPTRPAIVAPLPAVSSARVPSTMPPPVRRLPARTDEVRQLPPVPQGFRPAESGSATVTDGPEDAPLPPTLATPMLPTLTAPLPDDSVPVPPGSGLAPGVAPLPPIENGIRTP